MCILTFRIQNGQAGVDASGCSLTTPSLVFVTEIQNEGELLSLPAFTLPLRTTPSDDDLEEIYQLALQYQTVCATVTAGEEIRQETFSVAWDFSAIDQTTPGEYAAAGRIELPEGYSFGETVLQELQISVRVEEMTPAVITSIEQWYPYTNAFALPQGSEIEALEELFAASPYYLECYAENGTSYTAVVEWDFSCIDLNTVGLYHATGRLTAPENTVFADRVDFPEITVPVSVQAPDRPDINCFLAARGNLYFPWVTPPGELDKISVWLSENNGSWNQLENGIYVGREMLSIATRLLTPGSGYRLQVDYDGGQTGMMASHLSLGAIRFFSASVFCYKAASALYLLIIAVLAIHRGEKRSRPIFYAAAAATCAFIWDRLLPVYEPVIGGWFVEWGSFFIAAAIGYSLWRDVIEGYGNSLIFQEERKQVIRQLSMQTEYSRQVSEAAAENRRLIHDIKHHLRTIDRMASEHGQTEICSFLLQVEEQVAATSGHSHVAFCKNPVVNALIEYYYGMAQTQGTEFQVRLDLPDQIPLTDVELCTVLGNLLDNAVEACSRQKQGVRRILVAGETRGNMYFLKIENTYDGLAFQEGKTFLSRKGASADHGIGLSSVRKIIEGHGGDLDLVPGEESFLVGITIQM